MLKPPARPTAPAPKGSKPASAAGPARGAPAKKAAPRVKPAGTHSGRLSVAILGGLAAGRVAMLIYGIVESRSDYAFNRPAAQLPSLQSKHTLQ